MAAVNLIGSYNYALVALSVLIAMFASYAALDLASRVTAAGGWTRAVWLLGGAGAMGTGIWSMHYIGMLAFILPIPVAYHWPTVLLSLLAAILASVVALGVVSRQKMGAFRALAGSVLMGAGISSMHYIGMAAMRLPAVCQFNSFLVVLSVVFAILISLAALWITFHFRDEKTGIGWEKLAGAVVMGAAIPVMHYTGMAAASFTPSGMPADLSHALSISTLGAAGIAAVTFIVLGLALLTSWMDRRFAAQTLELQEEKLQQSEAYLSEAQRLSHTGSFGWRVSTGEIIWSEETFRIFQYDRTTTPTVELILQRVHPEDAALVRQTIERASQDGKDFEHEYRLVMPEGGVKHVHVVAHAERDESGELEFVGAVMDTTESKRVEKKLRRSEESLLEAQKLSHTGSWRHDVASGAVVVSPEIYRIHGIKPDDDASNAEFFFSEFHPEDRKRVVELFERAEIEKTEFQVDYRIVLPDGTIKHLHTTGHPILNESGDLAEFVGTAMDVTAAKQAEEALRRSESYLADAQRLTRTGSWAWNVATRQSVYWSQENFRLFGFDPEGGIPSDEAFYQRIHPEDRDRVRREVFLERPDEGSHFDAEFRIVLPGGAIRYVRSTGHPVRNISGDLLEYVGTSIDVTERKRGEQATHLLAAVVESSHDAIVSKDLDGIISSWNKGAERLFGYAAEEAVGQNITLIIPPDRRDEERAIIERLTRGERVDHFETVRMRKDGSLLDVALTISPMKDAAGRIVGASKLARDITERKRAEEALRQAQADLAYMSRVTTMGELTASLAHEIRQPISAAVIDAKTCLRWLGRDEPDVAKACETASRIVKDVTRAADIIGRISSLFKKGALQRELVDVNELIREMIVLLRSEASRYSISIRTELADGVPKIMADRVQLQQVFMNLMLNGIDAMKETSGGSELAIKSEAGDGQLLISVSDTGVGLPSEQADEIFRAFFTTKDNGTGMGLPISRSIIESHGGRLWATTNAGPGATLQFTLPATVAAHA
jgi:PAS domain S-box-containing protein